MEPWESFARYDGSLPESLRPQQRETERPPPPQQQQQLAQPMDERAKMVAMYVLSLPPSYFPSLLSRPRSHTQHTHTRARARTHRYWRRLAGLRPHRSFATRYIQTLDKFM